MKKHYFCRRNAKNVVYMQSGNIYNFTVTPNEVDFSLRARLTAMCGHLLNTAGTDADRNKFGTEEVMKQNNSWVLSRLTLEFDYLPKQYDEFNVRTWIIDTGRVVSVRNFVISDSEGQEFGRATSHWCLINLDSRRPCDLTPILEARRQYIFDEPAPCEGPRKLVTFEGGESVQHPIVYSDIDLNRHVNTLRYIEMMVDALPIEVVAEPHKMRVDLHFVKESRYGQTLSIRRLCNEGSWLFEITSDDGGVVCRAAFDIR